MEVDIPTLITKIEERLFKQLWFLSGTEEKPLPSMTFQFL